MNNRFDETFIRDYTKLLYIDGSYTTKKLSPGDVDLIVFWKDDFSPDWHFLQRLHRYQDEQVFNLHIFTYIPGFPNEDAQRKYMSWLVDHFQQNDRFDPPVTKGIVLVRGDHD